MGCEALRLIWRVAATRGRFPHVFMSMERI